MSEWQPIETAPRDGTELLAWWPGPGMGLPAIGWQITNWGRIAGSGMWFAHSLVGKQPTHWMPLPPPPAENHDG